MPKPPPTHAQSNKLQKVLASHGLGSRRVMEQWIVAGRVKVNGKTATQGDRVTVEDRIVVDGRVLSQKEVKHRVLLYNKPTGEICSRDDPEGRPSVFKNLPRIKNQRWVAVGRLDFNTSGLLLLTTDGDLANRLMHPSSNIEREYAVRVLGDVTDEKLKHMKEGVLLEDGVASFSDIRKGEGEGSANQWYYVVLMEGRNREVRRLWESQELTVSRLKRVRFGGLFIPSAIKAGHYRELNFTESKELYRMSTEFASSKEKS